MKSINEFLNDSGLDNILLEVLSNTREYTDAEIFESLDILFEAANASELHPKDGEEVMELLDITQRDGRQKISKINAAYRSWEKTNTLDPDRVPFKLCEFDEDGKYINYDKISNGIVLYTEGFKPLLKIFPNNGTLKELVNEKNIPVLQEKYHGKSLLINVFDRKNYLSIANIMHQTPASESAKYYYDYDFSKSFIDNVFTYILGPDFNIDELKDGEQNPDIQRGRDLKGKKTILAELCKFANVTGDQLLKVIKKCTGDRELTEDTITGLSLMICGALSCMRNGGKGDKKAVGALCERILKIVNNPKTGLRYILK